VYGSILKNKLGISDKKTYNGIDFSFIDNKDLLISLFIGFYDGDGCVSNYDKNNQIRSIKIECHKNWDIFFIMCKDKLKEYLNVDSTIRVTKKDSVILSLNKKSNIEILKKYAIDNNLPIMTRKWINKV
jgi:hypothetical protein